MPDVTTSASLTYAGGTIRTGRMVPALLSFLAGDLTTSSATSGALVSVPELDRLVRLVDRADGESEEQFQRRQLIWQQTMEAIEAAFKAINDRVDAIALEQRLIRTELLAQQASDKTVELETAVNDVNTAVSQTLSSVDPIYGIEYNDLIPPGGIFP